jgi:hypothetical protein
VSTYKLNLAVIRGCPPAQQLYDVLNAAGVCQGEELGVRDLQPPASSLQPVRGILLNRITLDTAVEDPATGRIENKLAQSVKAYPFAIWSDAERMETYAGAAGSLKLLEAFLGGMGLPVVVDFHEVNLLEAVRSLAKVALVKKFSVRSARVSDYAANSYMIGTYGPKFVSTEHALEFLEKYEPAILAVAVRLAGRCGKLTLNLSPKACFGVSCEEVSRDLAIKLLRELCGHKAVGV